MATLRENIGGFLLTPLVVRYKPRHLREKKDKKKAKSRKKKKSDSSHKHHSSDSSTSTSTQSSEKLSDGARTTE